MTLLYNNISLLLPVIGVITLISSPIFKRNVLHPFQFFEFSNVRMWESEFACLVCSTSVRNQNMNHIYNLDQFSCLIYFAQNRRVILSSPVGFYTPSLRSNLCKNMLDNFLSQTGDQNDFVLIRIVGRCKKDMISTHSIYGACTRVDCKAIFWG